MGTWTTAAHETRGLRPYVLSLISRTACIALPDTEGRVLYTSSALQRILGLARDALLGMPG